MSARIVEQTGCALVCNQAQRKALPFPSPMSWVQNRVLILLFPAKLTWGSWQKKLASQTALTSWIWNTKTSLWNSCRNLVDQNNIDSKEWWPDLYPMQGPNCISCPQKRPPQCPLELHQKHMHMRFKLIMEQETFSTMVPAHMKHTKTIIDTSYLLCWW
jgi:hypothetical protein